MSNNLRRIRIRLAEDTRRRLSIMQELSSNKLDFDNIKFLKNNCQTIVENLIGIETIDKITLEEK